MVITQSSFRQWFKENVDDEQREKIRHYGFGIGITHLIYDSEMRPLWDHFSQEIWDIALDGRTLAEFAEHREFVCPASLVSEMIWAAAAIVAIEMEVQGDVA